MMLEIRLNQITLSRIVLLSLPSTTLDAESIRDETI